MEEKKTLEDIVNILLRLGVSNEHWDEEENLAWFELLRLARLGAAVEAMPEGFALWHVPRVSSQSPHSYALMNTGSILTGCELHCSSDDPLTALTA